jgi:excisionase family DNA binding protein
MDHSPLIRTPWRAEQGRRPDSFQSVPTIRSRGAARSPWRKVRPALHRPRAMADRAGCNSVHLHNNANLSITLEFRNAEEGLLSIREAAARLGLGVSHVYRLCGRGVLALVRTPRGLRISEATIGQFQEPSSRVWAEKPRSSNGRFITKRSA